MKPSSRFAKGSGSALIALLLCASLSGCVVTGDGAVYGTDGSVDVSYDTGVDYVEPTGVVVGGWATGYNVGPPRFGGGPVDPHRPPGGPVAPHPINGGVHPAPNGNGTHAYRPAPASHSAPSIPSGHHK